MSSQTTGADWAVNSQDKAKFDTLYARIDSENRGYITGDQAVGFFSNSRLPEDVLAQIWDLADINSEGQLNREEFAVAMYLIQQQLSQKDGRGAPVPQTLPPNLVPPSMRRQPVPPPKTTAPDFDAAATTAPKSAAEDLFGLDAFSAPAPQAPQSTGGSTAYTPSSPQAPSSPQRSQAQQSNPPSAFKPFVPSSSFGQTLMTPQTTGYSGGFSGQPNSGISQSQPSASEDLLGDNDPEVSKRLTHETSELANLSNQVGTLTNQMQEVKTKRTSVDQNLNQVSSQKRDFELRLSQLRSAYNKEVEDVKALENRLAQSRNETTKIQQDFAMLDGTYQDLQSQHKQVATALEADQRENAALKERIRQTNMEISELKPKLEKLRSDARQQKGLVAINKKQLSTNETERDKLKNDMGGASKELEEATREAEESKRNAQPPQQVLSPPAVSSPSPAGQSMNPFFRRASSAAERTISPQPTSQSLASPNHNAFDSFFGQSFAPSAPMSAAIPPTSFGTETPNRSLDMTPQPEQLASSSHSPEVPASFASTSPPALHDTPPVADPPAPPQSRQITSSFLPFKNNVQRSGSSSSSVKVSVPASRFGDEPGSSAPSSDQPIDQVSTPLERPRALERTDTDESKTEAMYFESPLSQQAAPTSSVATAPRPTASTFNQKNDIFHDFGQPSGPPIIPGAFPGDSTPPVQRDLFTSKATEEHPQSSVLQSATTPSTGNGSFAMAREQAHTPTSAKDDFDAAFSGFGNSGKTPEKPEKPFAYGDVENSAGKSNGEFPPIQEFGVDEDSESDSDHGFDDNFTAASPPRLQPGSEPIEKGKAPVPSFPASELASLTPQRPTMESMPSNASQLPTPGAQKSPPTYDQSMSSPDNVSTGRRESNQFPKEYSGLLPSREDPTSPTTSAQTLERTFSSPTNGDTSSDFFDSTSANQRTLSGSSLPPTQMPMPAGATAAPFAFDNSAPAEHARQQPPLPEKQPFDAFDDEFGDLSEAKEADDRGEDDFDPSHHESTFDDFNPTFDSPALSKLNNHTPSHSDHTFHEFESNVSGPAQPTPSRQPSQPTSSHDWDAMFAGLDSSTGGNSHSFPQPNIPPKEQLSPTSANQGFGAASSSLSAGEASKPPLARAVSTGTEHDDPILKRLTGMGYRRDESLSALERFDYNIDKVSLTDT